MEMSLDFTRKIAETLEADIFPGVAQVSTAVGIKAIKNEVTTQGLTHSCL